jgi:hypothetical protein
MELALTPDDRVEGTLAKEGSDTAEGFSGWLHLLALLEAALQLGEEQQKRPPWGLVDAGAPLDTGAIPEH